MKAWSPHAVNGLLKLEGGPAGEAEGAHGSAGCEELSFDFLSISTGSYTDITLFPPGGGKTEFGGRGVTSN